MTRAKTMRAAVLAEPGRIELRDFAVPEPSKGALLVRVRAALTDGTDLKTYRRGHPHMPLPTRFGHEFSGDVAAVGAGETAFAVGDGIMSVHTAPCGRCYWCDRAQEELCESIMSTMILGAYAQYIEIPARIVARNTYRKPDDLSYAAAAFLEPLSCVVHSIELLDPRPGSTVLVYGAGGFGLLHCLLLQRRGCRPVLAGRRKDRLDLARRMGMADIVDTAEADLYDALRERTEDRGVDAVIECTGRKAVWESAPSFVRAGGTVSFFGGLPPGTKVTFPAQRMHYDEIRLISPFHFTPRNVAAARDLLVSKTIDPVALITETVDLQRIVEVFARLDRGDGMKFAIEP